MDDDTLQTFFTLNNYLMCVIIVIYISNFQGLFLWQLGTFKKAEQLYNNWRKKKFTYVFKN